MSTGSFVKRGTGVLLPLGGVISLIAVCMWYLYKNHDDRLVAVEKSTEQIPLNQQNIEHHREQMERIELRFDRTDEKLDRIDDKFDRIHQELRSP